MLSFAADAMPLSNRQNRTFRRRTAIGKVEEVFTERHELKTRVWVEADGEIKEQNLSWEMVEN